MSQGVVNTIELDAVRREMNDKWLRRREQVWSHVEKTMQTSLPDTSFFARVSDTSYLICLPGLSGGAAQSLSARLLRDVLVFFLGSSTHADIIVRNVTALDGEQITSAPVVLRNDLVPDASPPAEPQASESAPETKPALVLGGSAACQLVSSYGGPLSLSFGVEHVFCVDKTVPIARRIKADIFEGALARSASPRRLESLETAALASIDAETMKFAVQRLCEPEFAGLGLIVPIHIQTTTNSRGRQMLIAALERYPDAKRRLFVELVSLSAGTPCAHIAEAAALMRTRARGVFARLSMSIETVRHLCGLPLTGVVIDTSLWRSFEVALAEGIIAYGEVARTIAPAVMAGPLPNAAFADVCQVAGVTHFTLAAAQGEQNAPAKALGHRASLPQSEELFQLAFVSRAARPPPDPNEWVEAIVRQCAPRNQEAGITSFVLFHRGWFLQVMEGARAALSAAMRRIFNDTRHKDVQLLHVGPKPEREFPRWSLGGLALSSQHHALFAGLDLNPRAEVGALPVDKALALLRETAMARQSDEERDARD